MKLITFKTAVLAKDFYKEPVFYFYKEDGTLDAHGYGIKSIGVIPAPYQYELMDWLREKHDLFIEISLATDEELNYLSPKVYEIWIDRLKYDTLKKRYFDDYNEALETALQEALKLI